MRALVIYESMFGNTERIARAITAGLAGSLEVTLVEAGSAPDTVEADLLVIGGPTHAFGMTRAGTRDDARQRASGDVVSKGAGVREWLEGAQRPATATAAAAFDTRIDKKWVPGSAARGAEKRLRHLGFSIAVPAESFFVTDVEGPLLAGETLRARQWAEALSARLVSVAHAN